MPQQQQPCLSCEVIPESHRPSDDPTRSGSAVLRLRLQVSAWLFGAVPVICLHADFFVEGDVLRACG